MREKSQVKHNGVAMPIEVIWLVIPGTVRERRQKIKIALPLVVFAVKGIKAAQNYFTAGVKVVGAW